MTEAVAPVRIQRKRTRGWKMPPNTVTVCRPSLWGNPFRVGPDGTAAECVEKYRLSIAAGYLGFPSVQHIKQELRGKNLACWCPLSSPCHADVLLELANRDKPND